MTHEALLRIILVKPSLSETQFRVEVRRLKCVKYELDEVSSFVNTPPFHDLLEVLSPGPLEGDHTIRRYRVWESFSRIR